MAVTPAPAAPAVRKFRLRDVVEDPRILRMLALGFSSGLPLLLVLGTFTLRLADSKIDIRAIGLLSYVALPYSLKFLWAPLIDRLDVPWLADRLGRRRAWMVVTQIAVAACLCLMAFADPVEHLAFLAFGALLVAFCAATQDVVIDGWRIDAAGTDLQGVMAATSNLGYRLGLILAGAGALYIASATSWKVAYLTMAIFMSVGLAAALLEPRRDPAPGTEGAPPAPRPTWNFRDAVLEPLTALYGRMGHALWGVLLLVALFRLPDFLSGVLAGPLYISLGFTKNEIATVTKVYGIWVGIAGGFAGGWALNRLGMFPSLLIGAFVAAASHLSLAWLALGGAEIWRLVIAISIENFCGSFAGIVLIAYMSSLTTPGHAATQYALFSSLYALPGKLIAGTSGFVVGTFGFPVFFAMTAAVGIPVVALCFAVGRRTNLASAAAEAPEAPAPDPKRNPPGGPELASVEVSASPMRAQT
ncbi:AmpG family muropeptide MFS transporter [Methylobacterium organophilum]|uniref:Anhydromuropeptide permease n=1 Tax=Methylobacterium organophilum TaxID=410 RepID=A0ABQ4TH15_METOR|nr:AmpG family muropeptide MFS transporter [Methylobacterium organophilum]GJE29317.1 Anhydromuropeptide permease [Methylobacterium organophilum]